MGNQSLCDKCNPIDQSGAHEEIMEVKKDRRVFNENNQKEVEKRGIKESQRKERSTKDWQEPSTANQIPGNNQRKTFEGSSKLQQLPSILPIKSKMERANKVMGTKSESQQQNKSCLERTSSIFFKQEDVLNKQRLNAPNKQSAVITNLSDNSNLKPHPESVQNQDYPQKNVVASSLIPKENENKPHLGSNLQTDINKGRSFVLNKRETDQHMNQSKESSVKTSTFKRLGTDEFLLDSGIRITENSLASGLKK